MIDYCISSFLKRQEEKLYRMYVTDVLKAITENTQNFAGGVTLSKRYIELITREKEPEDAEKEGMEANEIVDRITQKLMKLGK